MNVFRFSLTVACVLITSTAYAQPLKVYILAGQSNMQGHAQVRTLEHISMDPDSDLSTMVNQDGTPRVCERTWISSIGCAPEEQTGKVTVGFGANQNGPKIGPEYAFAITLEKLVDGPILLIKTSWGGKSINTDFRPPSAGPYEFSEAQLERFTQQGKDLDEIRREKEKATGIYYQQMLAHIKHVLSDIKRVYPDYGEQKGYELSGFVWFQGWNDMVDSGTYPNRGNAGGYNAYSDVMTHFIRDVRKDLHAPKLPFVIGVLGVGGPVEKYGPEKQRYASIHQNFRDAMAKPAEIPEFKGNVTAVLTELAWDDELSDAKAKEDAAKREAKKLAAQQNLDRSQQVELQQKLVEESLSTRERKIIDKGISNFEFHYLGSAKIICRIGQAFAKPLQ
ncbi:MAG: sialate O-acetylesterase [Aureliella sp.]